MVVLVERVFQAVGLQMLGLILEVADGLPVASMQVLAIGAKTAHCGPAVAAQVADGDRPDLCPGISVELR